MNPITVQTTITAPLEKVWDYWTLPEHITKWCFASSDWEAPSAINDLREGGVFTTRMQAKDGSAGFDFGGTYTSVEPLHRIEYAMGDGRNVSVVFEQIGDQVQVTETFDPESENPREMQQGGWQAILDNFASYVQST